MNKHLLVIAAAMVALTISSCKKNESYNPPTPKNTIPATSQPDNAHIFLKAMRFITSQTGSGQTTEYKIGDAFAYFRDTTFAKRSAGLVYINTLELTNENNDYIFKSIDNLPGGVLYDTDKASWVITGDTNTGIQPLNIDDNTPFPAKPVVVEKEINTQASFILMAKDTIIADSTIFVIAGPSATLRKVRGPNIRSVVFTKEEMATLGTGRSLGLVQISPFNIAVDSTTLTDQKIYFMKQTIASKYVDLE